MTTSTDSLARAIDYLGAVEVAPGRYAFEFKGRRPLATIDPGWLSVSTGDLAQFQAQREFEESDGRAYGELIDAAVILPSWWSPGTRVLNRCDACSSESFPCHPFSIRVITADLETGAEVPA
jgi:hypothetical protein